MEKSQLNTFALRDGEGNIIIDDEGCFTCLREDGLEFEVDSSQVDFACRISVCNMNGTEIEVQLNNIEIDNIEKVTVHNAPFVWNDALIKLFLVLYKEKRDLVYAKKIKTQKMMWKQISAEMVKMGYNVSAIQAENKFKTMERAYKNVIANNKQTGRARVTCSYESELNELLGERHNIIPLATSGRNGLVVRNNVHNCSVKKESEIKDTSSSKLISSTAVSVPNTNDTDTSRNMTCSADSHLEQTHGITNTAVQSEKSVKLNSTAQCIRKCQEAINEYTVELKKQNKNREQVQTKLLEEHKKYGYRIKSSLNRRKPIEPLLLNLKKKEMDY